jgi:hypothetical protein
VESSDSSKAWAPWRPSKSKPNKGPLRGGPSRVTLSQNGYGSTLVWPVRRKRLHPHGQALAPNGWCKRKRLRPTVGASASACTQRVDCKHDFHLILKSQKSSHRLNWPTESKNRTKHGFWFEDQKFIFVRFVDSVGQLSICEHFGLFKLRLESCLHPTVGEAQAHAPNALSTSTIST